MKDLYTRHLFYHSFSRAIHIDVARYCLTTGYTRGYEWLANSLIYGTLRCYTLSNDVVNKTIASNTTHVSALSYLTIRAFHLEARSHKLFPIALPHFDFSVTRVPSYVARLMTSSKRRLLYHKSRRVSVRRYPRKL